MHCISIYSLTIKIKFNFSFLTAMSSTIKNLSKISLTENLILRELVKLFNIMEKWRVLYTYR